MPEWSDVSSRRLLFSLLDTNDFGEGGLFFFMSVENPFLFTHQVEQIYLLYKKMYIHDDEVKDTCI